MTGTAYVPIDSLEVHPDNSRQGDIGEICTSIAVNGWYGAVVCQHRKSRGKEVNRICAGEHRWRALWMLQLEGIDLPTPTKADPDALKHYDYTDLQKRVALPPLGEVEIYPLECDDTTALNILLADNGTNDKAGYDDGKLADVLKRIGAKSATAYLGTSFTGDDLDDILHRLDISINVPTQDKRTVAERAQIYNDGDVRQIVVVMTPGEFDSVHDVLELAMIHYECGTHSEAVVHIALDWQRAHDEEADAR